MGRWEGVERGGKGGRRRLRSEVGAVAAARCSPGGKKGLHASFSYLKNGQGEGARLAAPGLREADDVLACSCQRVEW